MLDALWIVLGGMTIVFAALGLLMVIMMGLSRWLRPKAQAQSGTPTSSPPEPKPQGQGRA